MNMRVAITGAAGKVGTLLRPSLRSEHDLVLLDRVQAPDPLDGELVYQGDLANPDFLDETLSGVAAIVHLAGCPSPRAGWDVLGRANVDLTVTVLDAALRAGVATVVYASSNHASGGHDIAGHAPVRPYWPARPCCRYGASKAAAETIGRWYVDCGLRVACLRLGWTRPRPHTARALATWLSPGDLGRLVTAALAGGPSYGIYYGISANTRSTWDITNAREELGYAPRDDAEEYLANINLAVDDPPSCQVKRLDGRDV